MLTVDYILPDWALSPLFGSDESGLSDEEQQALDTFISAQVAEHGFTSFHAIDCKPLGFCSFNDLDRLGGDCHQVIFDVGSKLDNL